MKQTKAKSFTEAAANTILGIALNQLVLAAFSVPFGEATAITAIMILVSFTRSYIVRRLFA